MGVLFNFKLAFHCNRKCVDKENVIHIYPFFDFWFKCIDQIIVIELFMESSKKIAVEYFIITYYNRKCMLILYNIILMLE